MRMVLLTAAAALASTAMAAQAQQNEQAPTIQPRAVQTETIRRPAPSGQPASPATGQSAGQPTTDSRGNETAATDRPNVQQPSATRRTARAQRQRAAERHRARTAQQRAVRTRKPVTTGQAARTSSTAPSRTPYARATVVARPGDRVVLTDPQVTSLNAAFTDYIGRMNVWSRPPWDVPATVGATVPGWIQVYGVPTEIVAIYPDFAGEQFVVIGDDIVVIEPVTRRIVAMISRTSNTAVLETPPSTTGVAVAPPPEERVRLTRSQIATIRTVLRDRSCRYERPAGFFIGSLVPSTAPACAFPERVVAAVPDIADFRFITRRNAVVVVDPADSRVVSVLR
jgi:Protein of unknown function (DUF1236)